MLAGLAMLCAHAMFKAALFMVVGIIDHATGTRDIRRLAWLGHAQPGRCWSSPSAPPRAWRRCRRSSASSPRRPTSRPLLHSASLGACGAVRAGRHRRSARCSPPSTACDSCGARSRARACRGPARGSPSMHRPAGRVPRARPPSWPPRACSSGCGRRRWTTSLDDYADTVPPGGTRGLRPGAVARLRTCRCCCRSLVLAVGTAAFFGRDRLRRARVGLPAAGQRRPHLRRGHPRRRCAVGAPDRASPSAARSRRRSR